MEIKKTKDKLPNEGELVIVYFDGKTSVGTYNGYSWTVLHAINNEEPISFGEVIPEKWAYLPKLNN